MDGKRLFAQTLRTNRRIFEIQTAYVQVWLKWWQENVVAENLLPVWTGKDFLLISWELIDGFSKFKRHMFRFDRSDDRKMLPLKIYFRFGREKTFCSYPKNYQTDFRNLNGICSVLIDMMMAKCCRWNLLPVMTGKDFLLISWELIDGFLKFKRHMFRFDQSDNLTLFMIKIYFRFEKQN